MFLPTTAKEVKNLGWKQLDIILVTGDCYIDSPLVGVSVIGHCLMDAGFRVGIIGQPDIRTSNDITRLGEPALFWGVSGGCIDSMVANRTASGKPRRTDDYTPGGINNKRPDRAVIAYCNLIKAHFKNSAPIVLGGLEASLRRVAHYDYWSKKIRKSILFDSKADYLLYSMAEKSVVELAWHLKKGQDPRAIRGLCFIAESAPGEGIELPEFETVRSDRCAFTEMFNLFYRNNDPVTARTLYQKQDTRFLIQNPPQPYLTEKELDTVYSFDYMRDAHPYHLKNGPVKALDTIRFSVLTHQGCYGECSFCSIAVHQGRGVRCRSKASIVNEVKRVAAHPLFKGNIMDVGGPTANMYGFECSKKLKKGACADKACLFPEVCSSMKIDHSKQITLLNDIKKVPGVKRVFVTSGIRYDMILADKSNGTRYLKTLIRSHISGQMKIAPEHCSSAVLKKMGKPAINTLLQFKKLFERLTKEDGKKQFLSYYFIAAHPGCGLKEMRHLKQVCSKDLHYIPKQVQLFTPSPSTRSTMMYCTGIDPFTTEKCFVEKSDAGRKKQISVVL
ncbi:YgiQ family radical SAM protein [Chitinispirillales bacterium ANBcel5]|uniref:YgiQ family radical SAM protein n=1 Tax=Cellulosispirillum alkaliphilum TaxID=3039283 RepID=UPI002A587F92|nr:YgiQ family radical SAM protein [Chitinispirillales bacterium ANBcel5]